ncbi:hypothetical protein GCM10023340_03590 [Nocardioides marinquilinus]|uniref:Calcium-binding protein n=1 Tax=Nocardioides marinquilinus TaxID=1210400 RepID=A0ABP9P8D6_9ACTN
MSRRLAAPLAAALVASALAALPAAPAGAQPRLCQGQPVTKVGRPGTTLVGTERPDVLVTNGAARVRALGGGDRICVTRTSGRRVRVLAGAGSDRVAVQVDGEAHVTAFLGTGGDLYRGHDGVDRVYGGDVEDAVQGVGTDDQRDYIETRGGDDTVTVGGSRGMLDRLDLGSGDDLVALRADPTRGEGYIAAGLGRDELRVLGPIAADLHLDLPQDRATSGDTDVLWLLSLEDFQLRTPTAAAVRFTGTRTDETLDVNTVGSLDARLGRGDDAVEVDRLSGAASRLNGGPGVDAMQLGGRYDDSTVTIDAARGTASTTAGDPDHIAVAGFESLTGRGETVAVQGSDAPEMLAALGCDLTVRGGAGADLVDVDAEFGYDELRCDARTTLGDGEGGADRLVGSRVDDVLVGGPGTDRADGGGGDDVCDAETVVRCG